MNGVTVGGYGNGTAGNAANALYIPYGLALGIDGSLFVSDYFNARVMKIREGNLSGSIIAGTGISGNNITQLALPAEIAVDTALNLYINDNVNYRVMLWRNNSTFGVIKAGSGVAGSTLDKINTSTGLALDSQGNIYVGDHGNHRVMKWTVNATSGTIIAGVTSLPGNNSTLLNQPYGLYLDENNSYLYVADTANHRIQRFHLNVSAMGETVAGGNGAGSGSNQLNLPYALCVSKKTGDIYIADAGNHRIQRWTLGATSAITIAGITGVTGTNATLLNIPIYVLLNANETFLYVSDSFNHRVQRFQLS